MKLTRLALALLCISLCFPAAAQKKKVRIETVYGPIVMMLYDGTPLHRDNFLKLTKEKFYDSLLWHRVIPGFMIQGGDPQSRNAATQAPLGEGEYGARIPAEIKPQYFHKRGAVGMARDENPEKASSGCQFYIVVGKTLDDAGMDKAQKRSGHTIPENQRAIYRTIGGTPHLDGNYTVFGEVISGMDAVDKIANEPRNKMDRPNTDVRLLKVRKVRRKFLGIF